MTGGHLIAIFGVRLLKEKRNLIEAQVITDSQNGNPSNFMLTNPLVEEIHHWSISSLVQCSVNQMETLICLIRNWAYSNSNWLAFNLVLRYFNGVLSRFGPCTCFEFSYYNLLLFFVLIESFYSYSDPVKISLRVPLLFFKLCS